jgi:hypothetical protein
MTVLLTLVAGVGSGVLLANAVEVRRYSRGHVEAQVALAGRGFFFSRTPDGTWWRLRFRPCGRVCTTRWDPGEPGAGGGVREPLHPLGPGPLVGTAEPQPPFA